MLILFFTCYFSKHVEQHPKSIGGHLRELGRYIEASGLVPTPREAWEGFLWKLRAASLKQNEIRVRVGGHPGGPVSTPRRCASGDFLIKKKNEDLAGVSNSDNSAFWENWNVFLHN